jgi:hypothetical protein
MNLKDFCVKISFTQTNIRPGHFPISLWYGAGEKQHFLTPQSASMLLLFFGILYFHGRVIFSSLN